MSNIATPVKAGNIRVWVTEDGVHPSRAPLFQAIAVSGDPSWALGEDTPIQVPDPNRYDDFVDVGTVKGSRDRPTTSLRGRYPMDVSNFLKLSRKRCRLDIYELIGACANPQDFTEGWEKIRFWPDGKISNYSGENTSALSSDENAASNEMIDLSAREFYEIGKMKFEQVASADTAREVTSIRVCDDESCGDCGRSSDGCQRVLATMVGVGATPGTSPSLLYSEDGGSTWDSIDIDTMFSNETPNDSACIGGNFVIAVNTSHSLHFIDINDLYDGVGTWTEVVSGFVDGSGPNAIWSLDARHTWFAGDGGYIYFTDNPAQSVAVQDAGVSTTQDLNDIHAYDIDNVLAVGELNSVVVTTNGGDTWQAITGPNAGVNLLCCWMWSPEVWFIGDVNGNLWFTTNSGISWSEKALPITITQIDEIEFTDEAVGYLAGQAGTGAGRILRTMTGGYDWKVLPDGRSGNIPANDKINKLAACPAGSNVVFGAGLDDDGTSGIIVKAAA